MKRVLKWLGIGFVGLLGIAVLIAAGLVIYGQMSYKPKIADRPLYPIAADTSPKGIARGKYLMEGATGCTHACHTPEGGKPLSGYAETISQGPVQAVVSMPNLTPDLETGIGGWTDAEIARAIREGVDKDGVALVMMPSYNYRVMSDADVAAMIGYLRSLEPVHNPIPEFQANAVAKVMLALGLFGQDALQAPITVAQAAPENELPEYGYYLLKLGACSDCHGENYTGGPLPFAAPGDPPAANLTPGGELASWTAEDFILAVRSGKKPDGTVLAPTMPRFEIEEADLQAMFECLKTLPANQAAQ